MKQAFSTAWKKSTQPRKQRKYAANAPDHIKGNLIHATLSPDLRKKHGKRAVRIRKGDTVKVLRGQFKGKTNKIERVDTRKEKVYIVGIETIKKDGSKVLYPIGPSNVMITSLETDKRRFKKTEVKNG